MNTSMLIVALAVIVGLGMLLAALVAGLRIAARGDARDGRTS